MSCLSLFPPIFWEKTALGPGWAFPPEEAPCRLLPGPSHVPVPLPALIMARGQPVVSAPRQGCLTVKFWQKTRGKGWLNTTYSCRSHREPSSQKFNLHASQTHPYLCGQVLNDMNAYHYITSQTACCCCCCCPARPAEVELMRCVPEKD